MPNKPTNSPLTNYRDARSPHKPLQTYTESHNDDVTDLSFHPTQPHSLLSGSTDGLLNIYDFSISDEDDALLQVENHGSSINRAGFLSNSSFYALSHDEIFSLYHLSVEQGESTDEPSPPPIAFGDLRPTLDCEYVVDVIPSISISSSSSSGGGGSQSIIIAAGTHR